jgi:predicted Zn-dependent protease
VRATSIVLVAAGVLSLGALLFLLLQVEGETEVEVPREELAAAMKRYDRHEAMKTASGSRLRQLQAEARVDEDGEIPYVEPHDWRSQPAKAHDLHEGVTSTDLATRLDNAQTMYRERRYREAMEASIALLQESPDNKQLKRIIVRSACIEKDRDTALRYMKQLSDSDQEYLRAHCDIYGVKVP